MTAAPRVSCLLPVYNGEAFLQEALASILGQSFADFELVAVDDGSRDGTAAILARAAAADPRVRVVTRANGGIVAALNDGLAVCRGEYVARMDADDVAAPDRFAFQVDYLDRHPGCVLVGGVATSRMPDGSPGSRTSGGRHRRTDLAVFPPKVAVSIHPLITVRRAALVRVGGYRGAYPHAEDYDLFLRLAAEGTIDNPDREVLFYRRHEGAISLRHLDVQERSAARAEADAVAAAGHKPVPAWLFEAYVRLRIWRRCQGADPARAAAMRPRLLADALTLRPRALASRRYWRLRAIIARNFVRLAQRRLLGRQRLGR